MNDFTKEELMNIADAILYSALMDSRKDKLIPLRDKILGLIDNYCEHESGSHCHMVLDKCNKCGVVK
jgi:hypothetical protein